MNNYCFVVYFIIWTPFGSTVPKGIEWYLCLACIGAILGPWTWRSTRKWDRWRARKGRLGSEVPWTRAGSGSL